MQVQDSACKNNIVLLMFKIDPFKKIEFSYKSFGLLREKFLRYGVYPESLQN